MGARRAVNSFVSSGDLLVRVGRFVGSLGSPSVSGLLVRTSLSDFLASVDLLDSPVLCRWESAKLSSSTLIDSLTGEDEFSHGSVGHHGVNHALEFLG